jgi:hypothetical protein
MRLSVTVVPEFANRAVDADAFLLFEDCARRQREERIAASRPRRSIGACHVADGLVVVQLPARLTPDQARAWGEHLIYLATSAELGLEGDR